MPEALYPVRILFLFNAPPTTEIYTLSLHDALPISTQADHPRGRSVRRAHRHVARGADRPALDSVSERIGHRALRALGAEDRKSTRLNSSHGYISYAVFCLKKKNHVLKYEAQNANYA